MNKSFFIVATAISFVCFTLLGCGGNNPSSTESASSTLSESQAASSDGRPTVSNWTTHLEIPYEDKTVELVSVDCCETSPDYEYQLYLVARVNVENLTEKQQHYFDEDVEIGLTLDGGLNNLDGKEASADLDGIIYNGKTPWYYQVFTYPGIFDEKCRESFEGTILTVYVRKTTGETLASGRFVLNMFDDPASFFAKVDDLGYVG